MARQTFVRVLDDLTNEVLEEGQSETLTFAFQGKSYSIDLGQKNADEFRKVMHKYTSVATQEVSRLPRTSVSGAKKTDKERLAAIRVWARDNGYTLNERGRIKSDIVEAYDKANS